MIQDERVVEKKLFPKDPEEIAKRMIKLKAGEVLQEERELVKGLQVTVTTDRLDSLGDVGIYPGPIPLPSEWSYGGEILREALLIRGKMEVKASVEADKHLAKAVDAIGDLNETINILSERLRDWYSLHYPEIFRGDDPVELIREYGDRDSIQRVTGNSTESLGSDIGDTEKILLTSLAGEICTMREYRERLHSYVEDTMGEIAPNLMALTGPRLGGELIAHAGSLKRLAMMPSSTIQVLGAEKSLFRHLEKGTPPPKHGYILQHPVVHRARPGDRGKVARAFANKIAIAARMDHFGDEDRGDELKSSLERRVKEISGEP